MSKSSDNNSIKMVETDNQRNDDRDRDTDSGSCVANTKIFLTFHSLCILSNVRRNRAQIKAKNLIIEGLYLYVSIKHSLYIQLAVKL